MRLLQCSKLGGERTTLGHRHTAPDLCLVCLQGTRCPAGAQPPDLRDSPHFCWYFWGYDCKQRGSDSSSMSIGLNKRTFRPCMVRAVCNGPTLAAGRAGGLRIKHPLADLLVLGQYWPPYDPLRAGAALRDQLVATLTRWDPFHHITSLVNWGPSLLASTPTPLTMGKDFGFDNLQSPTAWRLLPPGSLASPLSMGRPTAAGWITSCYPWKQCLWYRSVPRTRLWAMLSTGGCVDHRPVELWNKYTMDHFPCRTISSSTTQAAATWNPERVFQLCRDPKQVTRNTVVLNCVKGEMMPYRLLSLGQPIVLACF